MNNNENAHNFLLLCDHNLYTAQTIFDHIQAFQRFSRHRFCVLPMKGDLPGELRLERFDGVLIHYSLTVCNDRYLSPGARLRLRQYGGWKGVFVQDDYRFVNRTVDALKALRIHALFGLAPADVREAVYSSEKLPRVMKTTVLAGYVQEALNALPTRPYVDRPLDVGYRARKLPAWIGSHAREKSVIADRFSGDASRYSLKVDISCREEDRIYGTAWTEFVQSCKAMLGTESGSSVCDFTGEIQRAVELHEQRDPEASFEKLRDMYFKAEDGKIMMNIISPRCFEAASLRTLMILYPGRYSGVLQPWRHYVPLMKDHSNMEEVVAVLRNPASAEEIIHNAYEEVALNPAYSYGAMVKEFDRIVDETFQDTMKAQEPAYSPEESSRLSGIASREHSRKSLVDNAGIFLYRVGHWFMRVIVPVNRQVVIRQKLKNLWVRSSSLVRRYRSVFSEPRRIVTGIAAIPEFVFRLLNERHVPFSCRIKAIAEAVALERIRRACESVGLRGTWLVWDSDSESLRIVGYDYEEPSLFHCTPLTKDRLSALLRDGNVKHIVWTVKDVEGIGSCYPLNASCSVTHLMRFAPFVPDLITGFITKCDHWAHWGERLLETSKSREAEHSSWSAIPDMDAEKLEA